MRSLDKFNTANMESGVSRSIKPSLVCSNWAAADNFRAVFFRCFRLKPGMDASTSCIVDALGVAGGTGEWQPRDDALTTSLGIGAMGWPEAIVVFFLRLFACWRNACLIT